MATSTALQNYGEQQQPLGTKSFHDPLSSGNGELCEMEMNRHGLIGDELPADDLLLADALPMHRPLPVNDPLPTNQRLPAGEPQSTEIAKTHGLLHSPRSLRDRMKPMQFQTYSELRVWKKKYVAYMEKKKNARRMKVQ
jgi:hypothetical protein